MDDRQSRIAKYYSSSLDQWNRRLFDRLTNRNFRQSVRYVIFMDLNDSFIIITKNWRTYVYGPQVCSWLGLEHDSSDVNEIEELRYTELKQVDYGYKFFVVLTEDGSVYMASRKFSDWKTYRQLKPLYDLDENYRMISCVCGYDHILLLREDGKLFTMGDNSLGQLGRNNDSSSSFTSMIDTGLSDVERIACGSNFSIAMTDNGVYSWGANDYGQLGINSESKQNTPKKIRFNRNIYEHEIVDIVTGDSHTMFLFDNGDVYECGNPDCFLKNKTFPKRMHINNIDAIACEKFADFAILFGTNDQCYVLGRKYSSKFIVPTEIHGVKTFSDAFERYETKPYSFIPAFLNISPRQLHMTGLAVSVIAKTPTTSISRNNDRSLCSICLDREKQMVIFPCLHLTSCEQCSKQMKNCPICRIDINSSLRVYIA
ncbi:hypothetical protein HUG17_8747 [Dermatophagoides farinae]|uniref:RING-type domain-containing protein n=1 Tax=Dermatophagoides farinae TaxID=6954 RepID=A0A9D4SDF1_DERFA|nr:RCC1 and BTB domain-containing protein 1-like [Dermatophagoides farinae]KAH7637643.1 hypothetical protein HUG17_8747 [Dermatophagoides farinae]